MRTPSRVDDGCPPSHSAFFLRLGDDSKDVADVGLVRSTSETAVYGIGTGESGVERRRRGRKTGEREREEREKRTKTQSVRLFQR